MRLLRISVLGFLMGLPQENHRTAEFANGAEVLQLSTCPSLCCTEEAATGKRRVQLGEGQAGCSPGIARSLLLAVVFPLGKGYLQGWLHQSDWPTWSLTHIQRRKKNPKEFHLMGPRSQ